MGERKSVCLSELSASVSFSKKQANRTPSYKEHCEKADRESNLVRDSEQELTFTQPFPHVCKTIMLMQPDGVFGLLVLTEVKSRDSCVLEGDHSRKAETEGGRKRPKLGC